MRKTFSLALVFITGLTMYSQQDAQYTQYMYNTISINPAYAGSRHVLSVYGLHRTQWVGIEGAPVTSTFSIHSPLGNSGLGGGLSFVSDKIGPTNESQISVDVSYTIPVSQRYDLSFGIKGAANLFSLDVNKLNAYSQSDSNLRSVSNEFSPNIGAGVYLHSDRTYLGLSVPNFLQSKQYADNERSVYFDKMHYYLIGGHVMDLSDNIQFKPSFLFKMTVGAPLQLDMSGSFLIQEKFVLGVAWRWDAAVSAMVGFQISPGLFIGYGYDFETTKLANYNSGSHEIFLRFELFKRTSGVFSPRFF